jgi:hypothetical protein
MWPERIRFIGKITSAILSLDAFVGKHNKGIWFSTWQWPSLLRYEGGPAKDHRIPLRLEYCASLTEWSLAEDESNETKTVTPEKT